MKKGKLIGCALIGAAAACGACAYAGASLVESFLGKEALSRKNDAKKLLPEETANTLNCSDEIRLGKDFYNRTPHLRLSIKNRSGEVIHSMLYKSTCRSNVYVICCHGYGSRAMDNSHLSMHLYEMGFNVIMPHMRAHEGSDHKYSTMGWLERLDVADLAAFIAKTNKGCKIILYGLSMGAATVMMATGEKLPDEVVCAIEDCGYTSVHDEYKAQIGRVMHLPPFPALNIFRASARRIAGFDIKKASALEQVKRSKTPTLFIHGDADDFVPFSMLERLYSAAACEKEKMIFEGADHATSAIMFPELYWKTVKAFIEKYI